MVNVRIGARGSRSVLISQKSQVLCYELNQIGTKPPPPQKKTLGLFFWVFSSFFSRFFIVYHILNMNHVNPQINQKTKKNPSGLFFSSEKHGFFPTLN